MAWDKDKPAITTTGQNSHPEILANWARLQERFPFLVANEDKWPQHFTNLLDPYGGMESWSGGAAANPDGYSKTGVDSTIAREGTIKKHGNFSAKLTRVGNDCYLSISANEFTYYQSRTVTLGYWVYATVADRAKITIHDGVGSSSSSLHDGGSDWDFLTVTRTLDGSASEFTIRLECVTGNTAVYFDGGILVEGTVCPSYMPAVKTVFLTTPLTDTDWDGEAKSDGEADIDLSAFGNGCPPKIKAVLIMLVINDSGSAAGSPYVWMAAGGGAIGAANRVLGINLATFPNDSALYECGWIPCDSSGDIRYLIEASDVLTMDVRILIYGYVLGE